MKSKQKNILVQKQYLEFLYNLKAKWQFPKRGIDGEKYWGEGKRGRSAGRIVGEGCSGRRPKK